jgi:putative aldouronate transport system permease protein
MEKTFVLQNSKQGIGSKIFNFLNMSFIALVSIACLFPFLNVAAVSLSSGGAIVSGKVVFFPVEFQLDAYNAVIKNSAMTKSFGFTILLTVLYTAMCMIMTVCAAYPLTKKHLKGRRVIMIMIIVTMYFNAGIIPNYIIVKNLGLLDSIWALILPGMLSAYNLIILRTFFLSISASMLEAAYLDGCSEIGILARIVLPLSTPILATLSLFYAVGRWNGFQDALYYINNQNLYPLQLKLREIILVDRMAEINSQEGGELATLVPEGIKAASIMFATLPILVLYPWLQRYFVSGVMIGSIKE